ncbi:unnamed protein product [Durusdinium trenchii]|uniref:BTB domain-containing protein n=1 Tax=Durusdinium trenchii TaxID=1381693 RepID=A0ABP0RGW9_9DINO
MFKALDERIEEEIISGAVSDVFFGVGPKEEAHFFSSRANLAMASPVFHAMFFGPQWHREAGRQSPRKQRWDHDCNQTSSAPSSPRSRAAAPADPWGHCSPRTYVTERLQFRRGQHHYVAVSDIEPSAFKCMLRYVHHLDPLLSLDNAMQVYRAADKYQIFGLLDACGVFLDKHVDPSNVTQVLRLFDVACRLGQERWSQSFLRILEQLSRVQTRQVLQAQEFLELHSVSLATLLGSDGLCVNEERLWGAIRSWAEVRVMYKEQSEPEATGAGVDQRPTAVAASELVPSWQDAVRPFRHLIRFPAMSASFFAKEVSKSGVLSHQEVVDIFGFLAHKASKDPLTDDAEGEADVQVGGVYRTDSRIPRLGWCMAPGQSDPMLSEEFGLTEGRELMTTVGSVVVDGRGLSAFSWGSSVILAGPGTGFHLAFGTRGFNSGRHAWTISWRPMDSLQPGLGRTRCSRGGAAGIARDVEGFSETRSVVERTTSSSAVPATGGVAAFATGLAQKAVAVAVPLGRGSVPLPASMAAGVGTGTGTEEPSARFLDWPSCIVFGVKRDVVTEGRYVAWEEDLSSTDVMKFSIVLDFPARTITYIADRGGRCWSAAMTHEGPVYPVIAASGPHFFSIEYGCHV